MHSFRDNHVSKEDNLSTRLTPVYSCCRMELLAFAVTYCTPDMIEPILRAKNVLDTQVTLVHCVIVIRNVC